MLKQQTPKIPTLGLGSHILQNQWTTMKLQICSGTLLEILRVDLSHFTQHAVQHAVQHAMHWLLGRSFMKTSEDTPRS